MTPTPNTLTRTSYPDPDLNPKPDLPLTLTLALSRSGVLDALLLRPGAACAGWSLLVTGALAYGYRLHGIGFQAPCAPMRAHAGASTVTGHSLGAGVAAIVALLLRRAWRDVHPDHAGRLRCIALSPPGGLLSRGVAEARAACTEPSPHP